MTSDLRAALVAAGAPDEVARKAAAEAATREIRIVRIETRLSTLIAMSGLQLAMQVTLLFKVFHG